jgi:hypothetical protein
MISMQRHFVFFSLALASLICLGATAFLSGADTWQQDGTLQVLTDLEKQSWRAWKNHDDAFFQTFLSDDHTELLSRGPVDKAAVLRTVGSAICNVGDYSVDQFTVRMIDTNTAVMTYHAAQTTTCGGEPVPSPVWATSIYVRRDGKWLNVFYEQAPAAP